MNNATVKLDREVLLRAETENELKGKRNAQLLHLNANHLPLFLYLTMKYPRHLTFGIYRVSIFFYNHNYCIVAL